MRLSSLMRLAALVVFFVLFSGFTTACGSKPTQAEGDGEHDMAMAPLADMPAEVKSAPVSVQQAYRFAAANPDTLKQLPCYCGCGAMGHTSNYACYFSDTNSQGKPAFDSHALGCSICVDITQDTMRLLRDGKTVSEIRTYIDATYAQYGPSNIP